MCDAHDDMSSEDYEERRRSEAYDGYGDCDAHRRTQAEADEICQLQGCVRGIGDVCIRCGRPC